MSNSNTNVWGSELGTDSNNIHHNFPALMSDNRIFTSWRPSALVNEQIQAEAGIKSNWEYRQYLAHNATTIMQYNSMQAFAESGNNPYYSQGASQKGNNMPVMYNSLYDNSKPIQNSDLKSVYLTSEQLQARMMSPAIPTNKFQ